MTKNQSRQPLPGIDAIYIINLASRPDRRQEMADQLATWGLTLQDPGVTLFPAIRPAEAFPFPSVGAQGCFMSHLGVLTEAAQRGYETVLVLEDDCNFTRDCKAKLKSLTSSAVGLDWSIAYGGALRPIENVSVEGWTPLLAHQPVMGAHFVVLRRKAILQLRDYLSAMLGRPPGDPKGGPMHVDGAISWFRRDHPEELTLLATPEIAFQRSSKTDIHLPSWKDTVPVVRDAVALLRRLKNKLTVVSHDRS